MTEIIIKNDRKRNPPNRTRNSHIQNSKFNYLNMGEGGPINEWQHCGFTTQKYRDGYESINGFPEEDIFKNLRKDKK